MTSNAYFDHIILFSTAYLDVHIGCGMTRAVIEPLSQHWGFYFNALSDDWGVA